MIFCVVFSASLQFHATIARKIPQYNTRIQLHEAHKQDAFDGETLVPHEITFLLHNMKCLIQSHSYDLKSNNSEIQSHNIQIKITV